MITQHRAKISLDLEITFEGDFTPECPPKMPSFSDEVGEPGCAEETTITKILSISIQEPRRDPLPGGGWTKTKWMDYDLLPHLLKFVPRERLEALFINNQYILDLMFDAVREEANR